MLLPPSRKGFIPGLSASANHQIVSFERSRGLAAGQMAAALGMVHNPFAPPDLPWWRRTES
ncbi:hypothetical protein Raf01_32950 [Rugosimonospora africana]|uniref:Uncharacterized protein n=1 Tax=Rugosimonospora africana TaxID=556532 RepID=A0A8J3QQL8_9ACTN|nr:hypothetical protein Raf01_32950 [Rugosimonospora africana]